MPHPLIESFAEQFLEWEALARGDLPAVDEPVAPEPPFAPFPGYRIPQLAVPVVDDGHRPSLLGRLLGSGKPAKPEPPEAVEEAPELSFELCARHEPVEISLALPPDHAPPADAITHFLLSADGLDEPLSFEIVGTPESTVVQFSVSDDEAQRVEASLAAYFPDAVLEVGRGRLADAWSAGRSAAVIDCALNDFFMLPIARGHHLDPFVGLIGALAQLPADSCAIYQVVFERASSPWPNSVEAALYRSDGALVFADQKALAESARKKMEQPLFGAVVRLAVAAGDSEQVWSVLTRLGGAMAVYANPTGNALRPVAADDYPFHDREADLLLRQTRRFGMLLGIDELLGLVHLPSPDVRSPLLVRHVARSHPAPAELLACDVAGGGLTLGANPHRGESPAVRLPPDVRVKHMHVVGEPGSGKSNFLYNMITDDIARGEGVAVLDPHGDLIDAVLATVPRARLRDIVLLDPTDTEASIGFNVLEARSEAERTLLSSDLVSMFERLSTTWGDQMNVVLRNAILAFLTSEEGGTLDDLRRFLVDPDERAKFLPTVHDPHVREYWERYFEGTASKTSVGAVVTRLGQLLDSPTIRYVLGQRRSTIDFDEIMNGGKIFLCKLPAGLVGRNDAYLFGSLVVAKLQQTAMARQSRPRAERRDFWLYIDEFQNFVTPSMSEVIAETRKYRLGMTLAHQRLQQLEIDRDVGSAVELMHTKVAFAVSDQDAKKLADAFGHFSSDDLRRLDVGSAIVRVGRSDHDFNLAVPLHPKPSQADAARARRVAIEMSRQQHARARSEIEAEMAAKLGGLSGRSEPPPPRAEPAEPETPSPAADTPAAEPAPAEGRGGAEHRGAVKSIRNTATELGLAAEIEKPLDSGGFVDLEVLAPEGAIAFEICITTDTEHEARNVLKCAEAGYDRIVTVCRGKRKAAAIRKRVAELGLPDYVSFEQLNYPVSPAQLNELLGASANTVDAESQPEETEPTSTDVAPAQPKEIVVGRRTVTTHLAAADDPTAMGQAERALKLIKELMSKPPEDRG